MVTPQEIQDFLQATLPTNLDFLQATSINPFEPVAPQTGIYGNLFQPLFGTLQADQQQGVWVEFLHTFNLTDPPPGDQATQNLFKQFASDVYNMLEVQIIALNTDVSQQTFTTPVQLLGVQQFLTEVNLPLLNPPTTGFYAKAFNSYFAGLPASQQQLIWVQFLLNNHFTTTPPPEDATHEALFMNYLNAVLNGIQNQNVQSPEEIKKRIIMSETFNTLLGMLNTLQDTIGVQSRNLILYGNWQQNYTAMMQRVPTYVGSADDTVHAPPTVDSSTDFSRFTLGYNNISIADIANWWAANSLNGGTRPFTITSRGQFAATPPAITGSATVTILPGNPPITFSIPQPPVQVTVQFNQLNNTFSVVSTDPPNANVTITSFSPNGPTSVELNYSLQPPNLPAVPDFQITFSPQSGSTPGTITWSFVTPASGGNPPVINPPTTVSIPLQPAVGTFTPNPAQSALSLAQTHYSDSFETSFTSAWNNGISSALSTINATNLAAINAPDPNNPPNNSAIQPRNPADTSANSGMEIPWQYTFVVASGQHSDGSGNITVAGQLSDNNAKSRAELNAKEQSFIENIRSKRQQVQNIAQAQQVNLDTSRTGISNESDLMTTILRTVTDIVKSILRIK